MPAELVPTVVRPVVEVSDPWTCHGCPHSPSVVFDARALSPPLKFRPKDAGAWRDEPPRGASAPRKPQRVARRRRGSIVLKNGATGDALLPAGDEAKGDTWTVPR
jgi:hypothetical protein